MNDVTFSPNLTCIEQDCSDCQGRGYVYLWVGNPAEFEEVPCPGHDSLQRLTKECKDNNGDINRMYKQGYTYAEIQDQLYLRSSVSTLQRYISARRKIEPAHWPTTRPASPNNT